MIVGRHRLAILGVVAVSLFVALFSRLYYLQVLEAPNYRLSAERQAVRDVREPALRGRILDRNGKVLVENRALDVVTIDREEIPADDEARVAFLAKVSALVGQPVEAIQARLDDIRSSRLVPAIVAEGVPESVVITLKERPEDYPGVAAKRIGRRSYPNGPIAAHVLGYVGEINGDELEAGGDDYAAGDSVGKAGVERVYDRQLRGIPGATSYEVDADGRPVRTVGRKPSVTGSDLVLSLDLDVQRVAEGALAEGLAAARGRTFGNTSVPFVADAGSVVVLDLAEGSVLAMASYPTFDPSALADGVNREEARALFDESAGAPFTNRAIQGQYAPGSTWKVVTAAAALERGLITPATSIVDEGSYIIPECVGRCRFQNAGNTSYGRVDLPRALAVSSDVYFYRIGADLWVRREELGENPMQDTAEAFGFGAPTGVALPSEARGRIPTPESRQQLFEQRPDVYITGGWFTGDNVNLAIGQGELTVTPMQLASVYGKLATGRSWAWNVALRVQSPGGELVQEISPRAAEPPAISETTRQSIMDGLRRALTDDRGTATPAFAGFPLDRFPVAGKTGTAQVMPRQDNALFVAVAPADAPRYAVAVVMEQAGFGSTSAAPVARRIFGQLSGLEAPTPVAIVSGGEG